VNGVIGKLGDSADPSRDAVCLDGERIRLEALEYWLVHKPTGVLSTVRDSHGRSTVLDLVSDSDARLFPVGRLDRDTEGLVLLTNDGDLTHGLLHPSHGVEREYVVTARGTISDATLSRLARGVELEDGWTAPAKVEKVTRDSSARTTRFHLTIIEGRKRQIRLALRALRHPVIRLVRIRFGPLRLGPLAAGTARPLTAAEARSLLRAVSGTREVSGQTRNDS
jgi:23S rRNA pseudouridine2605 synthase